MKNLKTKYPKLYAEWVSGDPVTVVDAPVPVAPVAPQTPKAALVEAKQDWEDEGGSVVESTIKPVGVKPTPKLPL